ncbi:MAG: ornithine cyclodeaminase family protein [Bacteroidetes bacterium]|nr:ornithine cyclodeaminase family protein [Bacteroidota bacterium]
MPLLLTKADVQKVLNMKDCIEVVEKAFAELSNGTAVLPLRINIAPTDGLSLYMPAYLKEMKALACKVVTVYKNNPSKHDLPTTIGKVLLQNPETGEVICIMDGGYLTAVRTGAASGVATKYLARKDKNQVIGIYGTGVQAKMQLWAMNETVSISKVLVYDLNEKAADNFVKETTAMLNLEVIKTKNPDDLLISDIICTATSSSTPLFDGNKLKPGTHINNIGSHTPNARELDTATVKRSKFVGDSKEACFKEAGDIMIPLKEGSVTEDHFYAELGELITGKKDGRVNAEEITVFKSNGLAIQDAATAKLIYDKAVAAGIGVSVII